MEARLADIASDRADGKRHRARSTRRTPTVPNHRSSAGDATSGRGRPEHRRCEGPETGRRAARKTREGRDFAALARPVLRRPGSATSGGDLPWAGKGTYGEPSKQSCFRPEGRGEISDPVKNRVSAITSSNAEVRPVAQRSFEDVRGELARTARLTGSQERYFALTERWTTLPWKTRAASMQ